MGQLAAGNPFKMLCLLSHEVQSREGRRDEDPIHVIRAYSLYFSNTVHHTLVGGRVRLSELFRAVQNHVCPALLCGALSTALQAWLRAWGRGPAASAPRRGQAEPAAASPSACETPAPETRVPAHDGWGPAARRFMGDSHT